MVNTPLFTSTAEKLANAKLSGVGTTAAAATLGAGLYHGAGKLWDGAGSNKGSDEGPKDAKKPKDAKTPKAPKSASEISLRDKIKAMPASDRFAKHIGII